MSNTKILLIEDDDDISRLTARYLEAEGYQVNVVDDGAKALQAIEQQQPDLVILDLMLPTISGDTICQRARAFYHAPILVLTALDDDIHEVSLLKLGADDYLNKPLKPHILVARIEALLRRYRQISCAQRCLQMDANTQTVLFKGERIDLTSSEFELLSLLHRHKGQALSRSACCQALRGIEYDICDRSIDMRVSALRRKLQDTEKPYELIVTVRNKGYLLNVE